MKPSNAYAQTEMTKAWRSDRLIYRAFESEDVPLVAALQADEEAYLNSTLLLPIPTSTKSAKSSLEFYQDKCMLSVVICLPAQAMTSVDATAAADEQSNNPIPIGIVCISTGDPRHAHHRHGLLGINILRPYHNQGYGSEAIQWALRWAFRFGNLHRIELGAFEWNIGAARLYERLGFVREGVKREHVWLDGRYWDVIELGMLESEWRERYGGDAKGGGEETKPTVGANRSTNYYL